MPTLRLYNNVVYNTNPGPKDTGGFGWDLGAYRYTTESTKTPSN